MHAHLGIQIYYYFNCDDYSPLCIVFNFRLICFYFTATMESKNTNAPLFDKNNVKYMQEKLPYLNRGTNCCNFMQNSKLTCSRDKLKIHRITDNANQIYL